MAGYNRVILIGNLVRDPALKTLPSNTSVCEFSLAVNRKWKDRDGNQKDEACFVDCAAFGRQGEVINQYMTKGKALLVEGRLKLDQWTDQSGAKRSRLSVVVEAFTFIGDREEGGGEDSHQRGRTDARQQRQREMVDRNRDGGAGYGSYGD